MVGMDRINKETEYLDFRNAEYLKSGKLRDLNIIMFCVFLSVLCACVLSCFSCVQLFVACSPPGSSVHGILRQEYWNGLPCPPPEDLPDSGIEPVFCMFPALAGGFCTTSTT